MGFFGVPAPPTHLLFILTQCGILLVPTRTFQVHRLLRFLLYRLTRYLSVYYSVYLSVYYTDKRISRRSRRSSVFCTNSRSDIPTNKQVMIIRTLLQVRRAKHKDPNQKKNHLGFGFLGHDIFKVLLGPLF